MKVSENKNYINIINSTPDNIALDMGYYYGYGVFETILVKESKPIFINEHLYRLNNSLKLIGIIKEITIDMVTESIQKISDSNYVLKISVSEKNIIFTKRNINYTKENYIKGFSLLTSNIRRNPFSHATYIKSLNYLDNYIEKQNTLKKNYDEPLFLNTSNNVSEGSTTNIFFIKDNTIYTPSIENGLLDGIVRQWVLKNYPVIEGTFSLNEAFNMNEVFVTNSILGIMPVNRIDKNSFSKRLETQKIMTNYNIFLEDYIG